MTSFTYAEPALCPIPLDLLVEITSHLPRADLARLLRVNTFFHSALFRHLYAEVIDVAAFHSRAGIRHHRPPLEKYAKHVRCLEVRAKPFACCEGPEHPLPGLQVLRLEYAGLDLDTASEALRFCSGEFYQPEAVVICSPSTMRKDAAPARKIAESVEGAELVLLLRGKPDRLLGALLGTYTPKSRGDVTIVLNLIAKPNETVDALLEMCRCLANLDQKPLGNHQLRRVRFIVGGVEFSDTAREELIKSLEKHMAEHRTVAALPGAISIPDTNMDDTSAHALESPSIVIEEVLPPPALELLHLDEYLRGGRSRVLSQVDIDKHHTTLRYNKPIQHSDVRWLVAAHKDMPPATKLLEPTQYDLRRTWWAGSDSPDYGGWSSPYSEGWEAYPDGWDEPLSSGSEEYAYPEFTDEGYQGPYEESVDGPRLDPNVDWQAVFDREDFEAAMDKLDRCWSNEDARYNQEEYIRERFGGSPMSVGARLCGWQREDGEDDGDRDDGDWKDQAEGEHVIYQDWEGYSGEGDQNGFANPVDSIGVYIHDRDREIDGLDEDPEDEVDDCVEGLGDDHGLDNANDEDNTVDGDDIEQEDSYAEQEDAYTEQGYDCEGDPGEDEGEDDIDEEDDIEGDEDYIGDEDDLSDEDDFDDEDEDDLFSIHLSFLFFHLTDFKKEDCDFLQPDSMSGDQSAGSGFAALPAELIADIITYLNLSDICSTLARELGPPRNLQQGYLHPYRGRL